MSTAPLVFLRPLEDDDRFRTTAWRNDPETRDAMMSYRLPVTAAMEARWFRSVLDGKRQDEVHFALAEPVHGACVGLTSLREIDQFSSTAWVSILIGDRAFRHSGLGKVALEQLMAYAKDTLALRKLGARILDFNAASQRLFQAVGFQPEGRLKEQVFVKGAFHDLLLYGRFL
ncbi:hypothetical protein MTBLM1_80172 [Rhodospirillaceae bacterium LM-1]|nr:hypothetical protein MTBLM1_80172 [Rhodospirillaceae bacterium LM-1]